MSEILEGYIPDVASNTKYVSVSDAVLNIRQSMLLSGNNLDWAIEGVTTTPGIDLSEYVHMNDLQEICNYFRSRYLDNSIGDDKIAIADAYYDILDKLRSLHERVI